MSTELSTVQPATDTGLSIFDSGQFEQMYRVAEALGKSSLIPASLKGSTDEETAANCLLVTEQAQRWKLSPFAVAQCASVIHGRLMWEGKLVHAVIQALAGINLEYEFGGMDHPENYTVTVSGTLPGEDQPRTITGSVKAWKTTGNGSPWKPDAYERQLRYRGAREWARAHNPAVILGVYTPDELIENDVMRDVTPTTQARAGVSATANFETPKVEAPPAQEPKAVAPKGKQTKERFVDTVELLDLSDAKKSNGKTWWTAQVRSPKGTVVEMNTFSSSLVERLAGLIGETIEVTFTQTPKGGFALEDFSIFEGREEGIA